jgi:glycosyltransferase involved in cell wall biosynthesis
VLLVTNHAPPDRVGAFEALHERTPIELVLFGGRSQHATAGVAAPGVPHRHVAQRDVAQIIRDGHYRAVIASAVGRRALPSAWIAARRSNTPFVLWTGLWSHPVSPAHMASYPLMRAIYRSAGAIATYGPHVSAYVRAQGARGPVIEAPQAVDGGFWGAAVAREHEGFCAAFVGRPGREKGLKTLVAAWEACGLADGGGALVLVGVDGPIGPGIDPVGQQTPTQVRNFLGLSDVLVVPSVRTRTFREPWGLVVNEAMHQSLPVIASDQTGAAAGGLVRDERNGFIVPAGDSDALATALRRVADDAPLGRRLGAQAHADVASYTFDGWADGMTRAIAEAC